MLLKKELEKSQQIQRYREEIEETDEKRKPKDDWNTPITKTI